MEHWFAPPGPGKGRVWRGSTALSVWREDSSGLGGDRTVVHRRQASAGVEWPVVFGLHRDHTLPMDRMNNDKESAARARATATFELVAIEGSTKVIELTAITETT